MGPLVGLPIFPRAYHPTAAWAQAQRAQRVCAVSPAALQSGGVKNAYIMRPSGWVYHDIHIHTYIYIYIYKYTYIYIYMIIPSLY